MDALGFWLSTKLKRFGSDCDLAQARIRSARTLRDVVRAADVHADPFLRGTGEARRMTSQLHSEAERKAGQFVDELVGKLAKADAESRKAMGREVQDALLALQGRFPRLHVKLSRAFQAHR